jgi:hypothetical protein
MNSFNGDIDQLTEVCKYVYIFSFKCSHVNQNMMLNSIAGQTHTKLEGSLPASPSLSV